MTYSINTDINNKQKGHVQSHRNWKFIQRDSMPSNKTMKNLPISNQEKIKPQACQNIQEVADNSQIAQNQIIISGRQKLAELGIPSRLTCVDKILNEINLIQLQATFRLNLNLQQKLLEMLPKSKPVAFN